MTASEKAPLGIFPRPGQCAPSQMQGRHTVKPSWMGTCSEPHRLRIHPTRTLHRSHPWMCSALSSLSKLSPSPAGSLGKARLNRAERCTVKPVPQRLPPLQALAPSSCSWPQVERRSHCEIPLCPRVRPGPRGRAFSQLPSSGRDAELPSVG